jgi:hypothetical protein
VRITTARSHGPRLLLFVHRARQPDRRRHARSRHQSERAPQTARSRKPLEVTGLSRVRIPPPPPPRYRRSATMRTDPAVARDDRVPPGSAGSLEKGIDDGVDLRSSASEAIRVFQWPIGGERVYEPAGHRLPRWSGVVVMEGRSVSAWSAGASFNRKLDMLASGGMRRHIRQPRRSPASRPSGAGKPYRTRGCGGDALTLSPRQARAGRDSGTRPMRKLRAKSEARV